MTTAAATGARTTRARRTCHAVPGSSERFLAKAASLAADEVFLDLDDAATRRTATAT